MHIVHMSAITFLNGLSHTVIWENLDFLKATASSQFIPYLKHGDHT